MDAREVDKLLASYNHCSARAAHIRTQLALMQHQLSVETTNAMAGEALHAQSYDVMPHGNLPGNPVESLVLRYLSGYQPQYIREIQQNMDKAKDELYEVETVVSFVNSWMLCLNERERFVVEKQVIEGCTWSDLLGEYEARYGQFGKEGLRKMKRRAMNKIYDTAE